MALCCVGRLSSELARALKLEDCLLHDVSKRFCGAMAPSLHCKTGSGMRVDLYNRPHARRQDHAQDARATHNRRANDGAREHCTGLRHRPAKGGEGETPGRRASRVASAPNPSAKAIAHPSTSASAGPSMGRMTTRGYRLMWRGASRRSSGPTTTRSSRFWGGGSRGGRRQ